MKTPTQIIAEYKERFEKKVIEIARMADHGDDAGYGKALASLVKDQNVFTNALVAATKKEAENCLPNKKISMLNNGLDYEAVTAFNQCRTETLRRLQAWQEENV